MGETYIISGNKIIDIEEMSDVAYSFSMKEYLNISIITKFTIPEKFFDVDMIYVYKDDKLMSVKIESYRSIDDRSVILIPKTCTLLIDFNK